MTRTERIVALSLMIDELKAEQRITDWLMAHSSVQVWTGQDFDGGAHFTCSVIRHGQIIAHSKGATEFDARANAFTVVFANEVADRTG